MEERCDPTGLIEFVEYEDAEAQGIRLCIFISLLLENAEGQVCRHDPVGCIHDFADL
jgi:hypothetical protein